MFGEMGLDDVLKKLRRADESLTEFVAPLWPGVRHAAAWMEGVVTLFRVDELPDRPGYYLLGTQDDRARVIRPAEEDEARRYRGYLEKATVVLLPHDLAYPASFAERLQGITGPRPIHFATGDPLTPVVARFDGLNLFFDSKTAEQASPLAGLFSDSSIFAPGELLGIPGIETAQADAAKAAEELDKHPEHAAAYRLRAVLESAGGVLDDWSFEGRRLRAEWHRLDARYDTLLPTADAPITSGICLPAARGHFDGPTLTQCLLDHALDAWT